MGHVGKIKLCKTSSMIVILEAMMELMKTWLLLLGNALQYHPVFNDCSAGDSLNHQISGLYGIYNYINFHFDSHQYLNLFLDCLG